MDTSALRDLLLEVQRLDYVPRTGYRLRGITDCESVAEHSFHVAFLVATLASACSIENRERALLLALVHDLAEVRLGDVPRTAEPYLPRAAKHRAEAAILQDLLRPTAAELKGLASEAATGESPELRFVKACDHLQLLIKVAFYGQQGKLDQKSFFTSDPLAPLREFPPLVDLAETILEPKT